MKEYWEQIQAHDIEVLTEKEASYRGSWKKRGGIGAFMMLARKWDRIEAQLNTVLVSPEDRRPVVDRWDIFQHALADTRPEGLLDDIGDLRRYLLLVEAEIIARR